jgi:hypothetical protein
VTVTVPTEPVAETPVTATVVVPPALAVPRSSRRGMRGI